MNRTLLQDLRDSTDIMEGMVVLLSGDFRQTLLLIQKGVPADEIRVCIKSWSLWAKVEKISLKSNMRVHFYNDVDSGHYDGRLDTDAEGWFNNKNFIYRFS